MKKLLFTAHSLFTVSCFLSAQAPSNWNQNSYYGQGDLVINGTTTYQASRDVPANTEITNTTYWSTLDSLVPTETPSGADSLSTPDASEVENLTVPDSDDSNLEKGLIAWYPLDGDASDISGNFRNGVVIGSTVCENRHGEFGKAYSFDGLDDYITIAHDSEFNALPLTLSAWFKSNGNNNGSGLVSKYTAASWNGWQLMEMKNKIVPWYLSGFSPRNVIIGNYGENKEFETEYKKDEWNHAVTVFSKDGGFLYLNGELCDYKDWTGTPKAPTSGYPITIGYYPTYDNRKTGFYNGFIDDVRIYNRILTANEIHALHILESSNPYSKENLPVAPSNTPGKPPAADYQETITALHKQIEKLTADLQGANQEISKKNAIISELEEANEKLVSKNQELSNNYTKEIEKNNVLSAQVENLSHERDNLTYELNISIQETQEALQLAEVPFINGWVYDTDRGWIFTDAEHYPMVYTHRDDTWHYFELGSNPRYFYNFTSQKWEAWDALPEENDSNIVSNNNF